MGLSRPMRSRLLLLLLLVLLLGLGLGRAAQRRAAAERFSQQQQQQSLLPTDKRPLVLYGPPGSGAALPLNSSLDDTTALPFKVEAVRVHEGHTAVLYDDRGYAGRCLPLRAGHADLVDHGWQGGVARSARLLRGGPEMAQAACPGGGF